jgi:membrane-associated protein
MEFNIFYIIFHIGEFLEEFARTQTVTCYIIMACIIFFETGFVVTPFLPGDSMIFVAGALAAIPGAFKIQLIVLILGLAAICGDTSNYFIGRFIGQRLFKNEKSKIFNRKYLTRTEEFYKKHGIKTIIIARYVPIVRTFSPFVAGMGKMPYGRFISFSMIGGFAWVFIMSMLGYLLGGVIGEKNFSWVMLVIIIISVSPVIIAALKSLLTKKRKERQADAE